jgi:hypothetical protein
MYDIFFVLSAGGFMFEGMSDDDEDFQSVSQSSWIEI